MAVLQDSVDGSSRQQGDQAGDDQPGVHLQTWNRPLKPLVKMSAHINPVFTDRSVHMMMVVLALFHSDDQDESVRRVHEVIVVLLW